MLRLDDLTFNGIGIENIYVCLCTLVKQQTSFVFITPGHSNIYNPERQKILTSWLRISM